MPCGMYQMGSGKLPSHPWRLVVAMPVVHQIHIIVWALCMPWRRSLFAIKFTVEQLSSRREVPLYTEV